MTAARRDMSISDVVGQLRALGVGAGDVLLVHASFRAARPVEGGPKGLIEALVRSVGAQGTIVMPSWTGDDEAPFDSETTPAASDLGVIAGTFWRLPSVRRGTHPFAFAARGRRAEEVVGGPMTLPPHQLASPVGKVLELDGRILLLGVGHDANTSLHLAELLAGVSYRVPRHITVVRGGVPARVAYRENDHCCALFNQAGGWLDAAGLQSRGPVGHAESRLMRSRDLVGIAVSRLRRHPFAFLHPREAACPECGAAWRSLPNAP